MGIHDDLELPFSSMKIDIFPWFYLIWSFNFSEKEIILQGFLSGVFIFLNKFPCFRIWDFIILLEKKSSFKALFSRVVIFLHKVSRFHIWAFIILLDLEFQFLLRKRKIFQCLFLSGFHFFPKPQFFNIITDLLFIFIPKSEFFTTIIHLGSIFPK